MDIYRKITYNVDRDRFINLIKSKGYTTVYSLVRSEREGELNRKLAPDETLTEHTVHNFLKGYNTTSVTIDRLARILDVSQEEILSFRRPISEDEIIPKTEDKSQIEVTEINNDIQPYIKEIRKRFHELLKQNDYISREVMDFKEKNEADTRKIKTWNATALIGEGKDVAIIGPESIGKTLFLCELGLEAIKLEKIPLYIPTELLSYSTNDKMQELIEQILRPKKQNKEAKSISEEEQAQRNKIKELITVDMFNTHSFVLLFDDCKIDNVLEISDIINRLRTARKDENDENLDQYILIFKSKYSYFISYTDSTSFLKRKLAYLGPTTVNGLLGFIGINRIRGKYNGEQDYLRLCRDPFQCKVIIKNYKEAKAEGNALDHTTMPYNEYSNDWEEKERVIV